MSADGKVYTLSVELMSEWVETLAGSQMQLPLPDTGGAPRPRTKPDKGSKAANKTKSAPSQVKPTSDKSGESDEACKEMEYAFKKVHALLALRHPGV